MIREYLEALESGRPPSRSDLLARHPEMAPEIEAFLDGLDRIERLQEAAERESGSDGGAAAELAAGSELGQYRIERLLGSGGMGTVYLATDLRLDRRVAIKVLHAAAPADSSVRQRFVQEARAISRVTHPHICALHDIGQDGGVDFLVMEYLDGVTLAERLRRRALTIEEALTHARQVADALSVAHDVGIIHRDLKPGNILLTDSGIKLVDFGLAKTLGAGGPDGRDTAPSAYRTAPWTIVGTAPYMSPEQARGLPVDRQTDIWSFGCVLYEALARRKAFEGETLTDVLAAILTSPPDWDALPAETPASIRLLLRRCIEKDTSRRLHDIADARIEIDEVLSGSRELPGAAVPAPSAGVPPRHRAALLGILFLAVAAGAALGGWALRSSVAPPPPPALYRLAVPLPGPAQVAFADFAPLAIARPSIAISPDGAAIALVGEEEGITRLYVRRLDAFEWLRFDGTEGAFHPFFSPDARWLGYFSGETLFKIAVTGGRPIFLCEAPNPEGADWADDGSIFVAARLGVRLLRVPAAGGRPAEVMDLAERRLRVKWLSYVPERRALLFTTGGSVGRIGVLFLDDDRHVFLGERGTSPSYLPGGHLLFTRFGELLAAPFDLERLRLTSEPLPVVADVRTEPYGASHHAVSATGTLAFIPGPAMEEGELVWVSPEAPADAQPAWPGARRYGEYAISPDGKRLAVTLHDPDRRIHIYDFETGDAKQLTGALSERPVWTRDGRDIIFSAAGEQGFGIYRMAADGSGEVEPLLLKEPTSATFSASPDGRFLLYGTSVGLWTLDLESNEPELRVRASEGDLWGPELSPDGKWLAYTSEGTDVSEVLVESYPRPGFRRLIAGAGAEEPLWSRSGNELFYRVINRWIVVEVRESSDGSRLEIGEPRLLFEGSYMQTGGLSYDHDPRRGAFLVVRKRQTEPVREVRIVLGLTEELRRQLAAR